MNAAPPQELPLRLTITADGPSASNVHVRLNDQDLGTHIEVLRLDLAAGKPNVVVLKINPDELEIDIETFARIISTQERNAVAALRSRMASKVDLAAQALDPDQGQVREDTARDCLTALRSILDDAAPCERCGGEGTITLTRLRGGPKPLGPFKCPDCEGLGWG